MTEDTLLSTNQLKTNTAEGCSNEDLPKPSPKAIVLSDIPHFTPSTTKAQESSSLAPPLWNEKVDQFEYEFTIYVGRGPLFVTLWDLDDVTACQRACACNLTKDQITYSETGIGFFKVRDEDWCFKKQPFQRSWQLHHEIEKPTPKSSPATADEILATL